MKKYFLVPDQKCAKRKIKRSIENNLNTQTRVNTTNQNVEKPGIKVQPR